MTQTASRMIEPPRMAKPNSSNTSPLSRQQILDTTYHCLTQQGYEATTIRRIAKQLDCAIGSIYRYFKDKHELLYAVTQEMLTPVLKLLELDDHVQQSAALYRQIATSDQEAYQLMFWLAQQSANPSQVTHETKMPKIVQTIITSWATQLGSLVEAQKQWSLLHGSILLVSLLPETIGNQYAETPFDEVLSNLEQNKRSNETLDQKTTFVPQIIVDQPTMPPASVLALVPTENLDVQMVEVKQAITEVVDELVNEIQEELEDDLTLL